MNESVDECLKILHSSNEIAILSGNSTQHKLVLMTWVRWERLIIPSPTLGALLNSPIACWFNMLLGTQCSSVSTFFDTAQRCWLARLPVDRKITRIVVLASAMITIAGCNENVGKPTSSLQQTGLHDAGSTSTSAVAAQGQIVPRSGILKISALPGDTVEELMVAPNQTVKLGQELLALRSRVLRKSQIDTLKLKLADAERQQQMALEQAQLKVGSAQLQVQQAQAQLASLSGQDELLNLAQRQLDAARSMLQRMESLADDQATRQFISRLEIDRQRMAVGDAELEFRKQQESHSQASKQAGWAVDSANQQLTVAQNAQASIEKASAVEILKHELEAALRQDELSAIRSPIAGTILTVDTAAGELTSQFPLLQIADLSSMHCEAEVYDADATRVKVGQEAVVRSPVFPRELKGNVERIGLIVGRPQLKSSDPLARVDRRAISVIIALKPEDSALAAHWLNLQVEVRIDANAPANTAP